MTVQMLDNLLCDRTPAPGGFPGTWPEATGEAQREGRSYGLCVHVPLTANRLAMAESLLELAFQDALFLRSTTAQHNLAVIVVEVDDSGAGKTARKTSATAKSYLDEIRTASGLTYEEIAPMLGVSRRTLHAWSAGGAVSARREHHLRSVAEAIDALAQRGPTDARMRLFDRPADGVSPYDLLAEGLYDEALDIALGRARVEPPMTPDAPGIASQLSRLEGRVDTPPSRLDRRFARRLGR
jgi:DNA-binding transcriptional regulator YiaG